MNVEVKPMGSCRVNVLVTADSSETKPDYRAVLNKFIQEGRIKGFRKGKAPLEMVHKMFGEEILKETRSRLFDRLYKDALKQADLKMVGLLGLKDMNFSPETGITFTLVADIEPDFSLPAYKGIAVKPQEPAVTAEEVDDYIERMRSAFAKFEEAPEGYVIQANDLACIDFKATIDGKPLTEIAPDADKIAAGTDFWFQLEEKQFLPEIIGAITGTKSGAEETVKVKFPKNFVIEALQGCKAVYEVKVKAARCRVMPSEKELCKQLHAASMKEFKDDVRARMLESAKDKEMQRRRQAVTEHLLKKADFDLPESELSDAVNSILEQMKRDAQYRGIKAEDIQAQRDEILNSATQSAMHQVRMRYIVRDIARQEGITATQEEIDARTEAMAGDYKMTAEELRKRIAENGNEGAVAEQVVFEKTLAFLLAEAK
jgi:trigger factor